MNRQRFLLGLAWLASLVVVYFLGGMGGLDKGVADASRLTKDARAADGEPSQSDRTVVRKVDESADGEAGKRTNIVNLVAKVRLDLGNCTEGMMGVHSILRALGPMARLEEAQIAEALAEVERTVRDAPQRLMLYSVLLGQWVEKDGKAALAFVDAKLTEKNPTNRELRQTLIETWAMHDPDAAWRWYQTKDQNENNARVLTGIFGGIAARDLESALQRLASLDESNPAAALQGIASSAMNGEARLRLLERTTSLPQGERSQLQQTVVDAWAVSDPEGALTWIRSLPSEEQNELRESAGRRALRMKPALAAEFLLEGATETEKPQFYVWIAQQWASEDPRAAGEWMLKQPQGAELDGARQTFAYTISNKDPAGAMDWAKSVQEEKRRAQAVEQIFQQWRIKDATAAEAALASSGLPKEKVQQLIESLPTAKVNPR